MRASAQCASRDPASPGCRRGVAGLFILKHMYDLSDEVLCARWIENPYYQYFCGELSFCHKGTKLPLMCPSPIQALELICKSS